MAHALVPEHASCDELARDLERDDATAQRLVAQLVLDQMAPGLKLGDRLGFKNFYTSHFKFYTPDDQVCGFFAIGGPSQRGTVCVEFTGAGCAHIPVWAHARAFLETIGAKLTRVDVAHDDYAGRYNLDDAKRWHAAGMFTTNGRPPAMNEQGWDDGSGRTVYIGKNAANQQLCVYEKGRQQGARDGDRLASWIRWEGRFGSKYRTIPFDVLTSPVEYLVGHFPPLARWITAQMTRMRTSAERAAANLDSAIRFAKRQCGALFNLVKKQVPEPDAFAGWIFAHVVRDRMPAWIKANPFASESIIWSFQT
jgi:DNA relaxase NicK